MRGVTTVDMDIGLAHRWPHPWRGGPRRRRWLSEREQLSRNVEDAGDVGDGQCNPLVGGGAPIGHVLTSTAMAGADVASVAPVGNVTGRAPAAWPVSFHAIGDVVPPLVVHCGMYGFGPLIWLNTLAVVPRESILNTSQ